MKVPGAGEHGSAEHDPRLMEAVLLDVVRLLDAAEVPHLVVGGTASSIHGRGRSSGDIDVLVKPPDAPRVLDVLGEHGFETERTDEHWIYKAFRDHVLVDVLFRLSGDVFLDEEMLARSRVQMVGGRPVRIVSPEDLIVFKALAHREDTARHWFDALGILAASKLDWDYLLRRARKGPRRVLSLLVYATSVDLLVPANAIRRLHASVFEEEADGA